LNRIFDQCDSKVCEVVFLPWFSFSIIHLHISRNMEGRFSVQEISTAIMSFLVYEDYDMEEFLQEHERLQRNQYFRKLSDLGLVKHATEMGMSPEELDGRIPEYGNCLGCQSVGFIYERCPKCTTDMNDGPWCHFMPKWTISHCFFNPRLFSKAFGNTTVPFVLAEQYRIYGERNPDAPR